MEKKLFLGFGVVTVMAGIYLAIQQNYVSGVCGAIVGVFVVYLNLKTVGGECREQEKA